MHATCLDRADLVALQATRYMLARERILLLPPGATCKGKYRATLKTSLATVKVCCPTLDPNMASIHVVRHATATCCLAMHTDKDRDLLPCDFG